MRKKSFNRKDTTLNRTDHICFTRYYYNCWAVWSPDATWPRLFRLPDWSWQAAKRSFVTSLKNRNFTKKLHELQSNRSYRST